MGATTSSVFGKVPRDVYLARSATNKTTQTIMAKLLKIAEAKDVPPGQAAAFTIEGQKMALFNVKGTY